MFQKGYTPWNKGKKLSEEVRKSISSSLVGNKYRLGKSPTNKGVTGKLKFPNRKRKGKLSEKHRANIAKSLLGNKRTLGKKQSCETKLKRSIAMRGEKHPQWRGGISFEPYSIEWNKSLKKKIRERDDRKCQICRKKPSGRELDVHHIDYNKKNCNPENLISLCHSCHTKTNTKRDYWILFFKKNEHSKKHRARKSGLAQIKTRQGNRN